MKLSISPRDGGANRKPKEILDVVGEWALDTAPSAVEARLFWYTRGKGTEDVGIVARERIESPMARGDHRFRFHLPEAPYSFSGRLISLLWAVELVADDEVARWEFRLTPDGEEILLQPATDAARR
jgi:hypothetical protein